MLFTGNILDNKPFCRVKYHNSVTNTLILYLIIKN